MQVTEVGARASSASTRSCSRPRILASRLDGELAEMKDKVRINGFRPGKVPIAHLKRLYGRSVMGEVVQNAVNEANRKIVEDNGLRLAHGAEDRLRERPGRAGARAGGRGRPRLHGRARDAAEVRGRHLRRHRTRAAGRAGRRCRGRARRWTAWPTRTACFTPRRRRRRRGRDRRQGDGRFRGHASAARRSRAAPGTDIDVVLGSDTFIPGFEGQLVGAKAGEQPHGRGQRSRRTTCRAKLAGQEAVVRRDRQGGRGARARSQLDDEFAKGFGFDDPRRAEGRGAGPHRGRDVHAPSRDKLKRALLDALDKRYTFELPQGLVEQEFDNIWRQVEPEQKQSGRSFEDEKHDRGGSRAPTTAAIAERRVRLGLVLAEVGEKAGVKVDDDEVTKALVELVRQYPGPGEGGLGVLPQEPAGAGRDARAAVRGEGRRPHHRPGQGHRPARCRARNCSRSKPATTTMPPSRSLERRAPKRRATDRRPERRQLGSRRARTRDWRA